MFKRKGKQVITSCEQALAIINVAKYLRNMGITQEEFDGLWESGLDFHTTTEYFSRSKKDH